MLRPPFAKIFFEAYLADHYRDKLFTLHNVLTNYERLKPLVLDGLNDIDDEKYLKSLRIEIRQTYYQAIETLFEMIFALEGRGGVIENENLWLLLSTSRGQANYSRIDDVASGKTDFLDNVVLAGPNVEVSLAEYLFYFEGRSSIPKEVLKESVAVIKKLLVEFAKDFGNRAEYNAIKHALRLFPVLQQFQLVNRETKDAVLSINAKNSLSYLTHDKRTETTTQITTPLDTDRDVMMGIHCSRMVSNIVRSRQLFFLLKGSDKGVTMYTFNEKALTEDAQRHETWGPIRFSWTPIYTKPTLPGKKVVSQCCLP